jgi:replicative DNA helicase
MTSNINAEQQLLGSILVDNNIYYQVADIISIDCFVDEVNMIIFDAIEKLVKQDTTITSVTIENMLNRNKAFIEVGGMTYISSIVSKSIVLFDVKAIAYLLQDLNIKRKLIKLTKEIHDHTIQSNLDTSAISLINKSSEELYKLYFASNVKTHCVTLKKSLKTSLKKISERIQTKVTDSILSNYTSIDEKLGGFSKSDLIIIAARPSMGKTAFALNLLISFCSNLKENQHIAFFSLEMSNEQISNRLLSIEAEIPIKAIKSTYMHESDYNRLVKASIAMQNMQCFLDDDPNLDVETLRIKVKRLKQRYNLEVIIIDYLQLLKANVKTENRLYEVSSITKNLKSIAKELNIVIIALSQLSRAVELRENKLPMLSDLRDSGSIEQDADIVIFLHRNEYYAQKQIDYKEVTNANIIIAKNRNGETGSCNLRYNASYFKFSNA